MPAGHRAATAGKSLIERMWELLDGTMSELLGPLREWGPNDTKVSEARGRAYGIAQCLALMTDPIHANVDDVRERAMERWRARQDGDSIAHPGDGRHVETGAELEAAVERKRRRGQTRVRAE